MAYYKTIGIDAGHGGFSGENYLGTNTVNTSADGLYEKHHTLELALLVEEFLKFNNFGVVMTRRTDTTPGNADARAKIFLQNKVDYGLSIHFNAFLGNSTGTEIVVPFGEEYGNIEFLMAEYLGAIYGLRNPTFKSRYRTSPYDWQGRYIDAKTKKFTKSYVANDYFGIINTSWKGGLSTDLLEVCFLDNQGDFNKWMKNRQETAHAIARAIVEGFGYEYKVEDKTPVTPPTAPTVTPKKYFKINLSFNNGDWNQNQKGAFEYTDATRESVLAEAIRFYDNLDLREDGYFIFDPYGDVVYPIENECDCGELEDRVNELEGTIASLQNELSTTEEALDNAYDKLSETELAYGKELEARVGLENKIDAIREIVI